MNTTKRGESGECSWCGGTTDHESDCHAVTTNTTKKVGHTPGPWNVNPYRKSQVIFALPDRDDTWGKAELEGMNIEANAALIAAVPELLDACKSALSLLGPTNQKAIVRRLENVITKAEGRTA